MPPISDWGPCRLPIRPVTASTRSMCKELSIYQIDVFWKRGRQYSIPGRPVGRVYAGNLVELVHIGRCRQHPGAVIGGERRFDAQFLLAVGHLQKLAKWNRRHQHDLERRTCRPPSAGTRSRGRAAQIRASVSTTFRRLNSPSVSIETNSFTANGGNDTGFQVITAGPSNLTVTGNGVQFGATDGVGYRFSLGPAASLDLANNNVVDSAGGATGVLFDSVTGPSSLSINGNSVDLTNHGNGIIFSSVTAPVVSGMTYTVDLSGTTNNVIQGATTAVLGAGRYLGNHLGEWHRGSVILPACLFRGGRVGRVHHLFVRPKLEHATLEGPPRFVGLLEGGDELPIVARQPADPVTGMRECPRQFKRVPARTVRERS